MSDKKQIIIGYSGHGFVVADAAIEAGMALGFYAEKQESAVNPFRLQYLGFEGSADFEGWKGDYEFILGIGDNRLRRTVAESVLINQKALSNVIHPSASISATARYGKGNFIAANVSVNALAVINDYCILNTGCIVEHECRIGTSVHLAPGSVLAGNVEIGENTFIGANAVIKQGIKIGRNAVIGAGAVVLNDIEDNAVYAGNPAKKIR